MKSYKDCQEKKVSLSYNLFQLIHHNFLSSFKIYHDFLVAVINSSMMLYMTKIVDYLKILTDEKVKDFAVKYFCD